MKIQAIVVSTWATGVVQSKLGGKLGGIGVEVWQASPFPTAEEIQLSDVVLLMTADGLKPKVRQQIRARCQDCGRPSFEIDHRYLLDREGDRKGWESLVAWAHRFRNAATAPEPPQEPPPSPEPAPEPPKGETRIIDGWPLVKLDGDTEPRILDTDLAAKAELAKATNIRQLIKDNRAELEGFGPLVVSTQRVPTRNRHGEFERDVEAFYLTLEQACDLVALMRTPKAVQLRQDMTRVFVAWGKGTLPTSPAQDPLAVLAAAVGGHINVLAAGQEQIKGELAAERAERIKRDEETKARLDGITARMNVKAPVQVPLALQLGAMRGISLYRQTEQHAALIAETAGYPPGTAEFTLAALNLRRQINRRAKQMVPPFFTFEYHHWPDDCYHSLSKAINEAAHFVGLNTPKVKP